MIASHFTVSPAIDSKSMTTNQSIIPCQALASTATILLVALTVWAGGPTALGGNKLVLLLLHLTRFGHFREILVNWTHIGVGMR